LGLRTLFLLITLQQGSYVIDQHRIQNGMFMLLLRAVAGIKIPGDTLVFKDDGPGNSSGIGREERAAWDKGKRLHILTIHSIRRPLKRCCPCMFS
jgi:hypothetical protein